MLQMSIRTLGSTQIGRTANLDARSAPVRARVMDDPSQIRQERNWTAAGRPEPLCGEGEPQGRGGNRQTSSGCLPRRAGRPGMVCPGLSSEAGRGAMKVANNLLGDANQTTRPRQTAGPCCLCCKREGVRTSWAAPALAIRAGSKRASIIEGIGIRSKLAHILTMHNLSSAIGGPAGHLHC